MTDGGGTLWAERPHPPLPNDIHAGLGDTVHSVRAPHDRTYAAMYPSDYDYPPRYGGLSQDSNQEKPITSAALTTRESIELFQEAVDAAHDEQRKTLTGIDTTSDAVKPKLTVDLRRCGLSSIPKEVIAIIKQDVERLHLTHNLLRSIAYEFSNCSNLRYLNLRDNRFKEIPQAIFGLPQLEVLELSRNRLTEISDDIESMKSLRAFGIQHNDIRDLPNCLGSLSTLKMLKLTGNPWEPGIKRILESGELSPMQSPPQGKDDYERDAFMTEPIKEYLRGRAVKDSGEDASSDEPLETPRAQSRFPVQPRTYGHSTSGSESASDLRSPGFPKQFPISRSHYRTPSSHTNNLQTAVPRRPGLAPLTLGSDRNRSNSESYLQATQTNKAKRMGLVTKKNAELDVLEETRTHRNSYHLRGQSHGSALRNGVRAGDVSPSGSHSSDRQRGTTVRRLLSLPEQNRDEWASDNIVEGARDVLYALHLVHPHIATMASVLKNGTIKTSSMEGAYDSVAMHVDYLDQELHKYDGMKDQSSEAGKRLKKSIISATQSCILAHQHVGTILLKSVKQIVRGVDPRYLRNLMLTFYGSLNEISNASRSLGNAQPRVLVQRNNVQRVSTITEVPNEGERMSLRPNSVTPTQERQKPERRWRQGSIVQQSSSYSNLQAAYGAQNAIPLYPNGRSRSNSRAGGLYSSASSSIVSTPRSAETFSLVARSRSGSVNITPEQARIEKQQAAQFERIFTVLDKATTEGLEVITQLDRLFYHGLDSAIKQRVPQRIRDLWSTLIANGKYCVEMSDALKRRLSMIRLNDPEARNAPDFWQLVTYFINSYHNLLVSLKESRKHQVMPDEVRQWVRPIHALTREAARLIAESPWNSLTTEADFQATPQPQPQTQFRSENGYQQHRAKTSGGSNAGSSSSPYTPSVPATPLSAALGPAAQATVPATPASAIEDSFAGNVWQRADTLQKNQTMFPSRR